jgi:putative ABC transport system ATP-binding protein
MSTVVAAAREVTVVHGNGAARVEALHRVTLELRAGEALALWGRSGSGKTTLLHALGGLVEPLGGLVSFRGEELSTLDARARGRARAAGIAYVFQGAGLLPRFTALENVAFARSVAGGPAAGGHEPRALLELVGLGSRLHQLPDELSGGERQRVAIARALAQRAELLLCDEPTGQLDSDTGARVLDLIDALRKRLGFALVVATHDAEVAARYDRVLELHDGRIIGAPA